MYVQCIFLFLICTYVTCMCLTSHHPFSLPLSLSQKSSMSGIFFRKTFSVQSTAGEDVPVNVMLKVTDHEYAGQRARFFALGRRINDVSAVASFMKCSAYKHQLWAHPQLIGYIDVADVVDPVITRDEFKQTKSRQALYDELLALENDLHSALERELEKQRELSMVHLEDVLGTVLDRIIREDRKLMRVDASGLDHLPGGSRATIPGLDDDEDEKKKPVTSATKKVKDDSATPAAPRKKRQVAMQIRFNKMPPNEHGESR
jgi:hypothetical protein